MSSNIEDKIFDPKVEFDALYFDKLLVLSIDKCLKLHKEHLRGKKFDSEYAHGEIIDTRNKRVEACLDRMFALHKVFDEELFKSNSNKHTL